jgi:hypothetical protein
MSTEDNATGEFVFRKHDSIGAAAAEDDASYLQDCFVDIGDLQVLRNCAESKRIVVGRTGAGKSALLAKIANTQEHVVQLSPHALSLNYIANNQIMRFFEEAGVNLTPFYMLLWKHIFVVELLRAKYGINTEDSQRRTMSRLRDLLYKKDHIKEQAVEYLETWGNRFWLTTDERMKELTKRVENSLSGTLEGSAFGTSLTGEAARKLSTEERTEVVERGKRAVNAVQIRELENIIQVLNDEIFSDPQENYYLTIDTLDEECTEDRLKYRLIKALIDTIRSFRRVENVKVIAAMRYDLLDKVLHSSVDPGFQEEKYESMYLLVKWTRADLSRVLETRLNHLVRRRYTSRALRLTDVLPAQVDGRPALEYMLDRTFMRPRDAIMFLNGCIAHAEGRPHLTAAVIKHAEEEYSRKRLQSLAYEWRIAFPNLKPIADIFYGMPPSFPFSEVTKEFLDERFTSVSSEIDTAKADPNVDLLNSLYTPHGNFSSVRNTFVRNLHMVGMLGIKTGPTASVDWATQFRSALAAGEVRPTAIIHIHPMFYRALGTRL